jgi:hypothetical protein
MSTSTNTTRNRRYSSGTNQSVRDRTNEDSARWRGRDIVGPIKVSGPPQNFDFRADPTGVLASYGDIHCKILAAFDALIIHIH